MRRVRGRIGEWAVAAVLIAGRPAVGAADHAAAGTGLPVPLGPGAVAVRDWPRGSFGNPALLASTVRPEWLTAIGLDADGSPLQGLTLFAPVSNRNALSIGFVHREPRGTGIRRDEWSVAGATAPLGALRLGTTLRLRDERAGGVSEPSFGMDLGLQATPGASRFGPNAGVELGLWLQNVTRPQTLTAAGTELEDRTLYAAAAYSRRLSDAWRGSGIVAFEAPAGATGVPWLGARLTAQRGFDFAVSARKHAWRSGVALRRGRAGLEYAVSGGRELQHGLVLRCGFGATLEERQAAAQRDLDARVAARLQQEIAARETREVESLLTEGREALGSGGYDRAAERFRNVLLWRPDDAAARAGLRRAQLGSILQQADSLVAQHDYWSAASQLEHAVRLFPEDSLAAARLEEARSVVNRTDRSRSEAAQQFRLGLDAFASQHYAAAIRCFEMAQSLDATLKLAGEFAQRSRQACDAQVQATLQLARGRLERRDAEGARSALLSALDAAPGHPEATRLLAQLDRDQERQVQDRRLAESRRQEESNREDRAPTPAQMPHLTSAYQRGMAMYRAGDLTAAMLAWEEVARRAPHFAEVDQYLLRVYRVVGLESYTEGRLQDAIEIWSKALQLEPENQQVRRYMDQANAKLQRSQGARGTR